MKFTTRTESYGDQCEAHDAPYSPPERSPTPPRARGKTSRSSALAPPASRPRAEARRRTRRATAKPRS
eukprot:31470-Pelagococcus_subviridis.AAC.5